MKTLRPILALCVWLLSICTFTGAAYAQHNCVPTKPLTPQNLAFQAGEKIEFTCHYKWGPINADVATAYVNLDTVMFQGRQMYHTRVFGKSAKFYDVFFKIREDFQSWFTVDGLVPARFVRLTNEGNYSCTNDYIYDWKAGHINADLYSTKRGQRTMEIPLTPCTYDLPSLFYVARNMDMSKVREGQKYPMTFAIDDDLYDIYFIWLGREEKVIRGIGTVKCMKFAFSLVAGQVFDGSAELYMWVSDDDNRIPILFEVPIRVGTVSGRISAYSGLKFPFKALVK